MYDPDHFVFSVRGYKSTYSCPICKRTTIVKEGYVFHCQHFLSISEEEECLFAPIGSAT